MFSRRSAARLAFVLVLLAVLVFAGRFVLPDLRFEDDPVGPISWQVKREAFLHEIVEKGELESGDNVACTPRRLCRKIAVCQPVVTKTDSYIYWSE